MSYTKDKLNEIVKSFVEKLEDGCAPWVRPFALTKGGGDFPINRRTHKPYRGINVLILWLTANVCGFSSRYWLTFKQASALGGRVKKGQKGTQIMFWSELEKGQRVESTEDESSLDKSWVLRFYTVFNLDQIENISDPDSIDDVSLPGEDLCENPRVMEFVGKTGAELREGNVPCYIPSQDRIEMPSIKTFISDKGYHASLLHELSHWTGHKDRLNRIVHGNRFGDNAYAFEELTAEIGSAFLCSYLGVPLENAQHPEYLSHWAKVIGEKPSILWKAASQSQILFDYLLRITGERVEESEESWEEVGAA